MRIRLAVLLLLALAIGCGDGGVTGLPGGEFPFDTTGLGGGGGVSTSGQRMRALDTVEALLATLPGQDFATETTALVGFLNAMPQFAEAGASSDGTVWARFTDGTQLMILHGPPAETPGSAEPVAFRRPESLVLAANVEPSPVAFGRPESLLLTSNGEPSRVAPGPRPDPSARSSPVARPIAATAAPATRVARVRPGSVPKSNRYRLFDAMGSYFVPDMRVNIEQMLIANGYTGSRETATLNALRGVSGDGIFYIRSHGGFGSFKRDGSTSDMYALWTADAALDSVAEASDPTLLDDLKNHRVVYMLFRGTRFTQALPVLGRNRNYGITQAFVAHYMRFSDNSLVYVDACSSSVLPAFRNAFTTASAFFGWSERAAFQQMGPTAAYIFDRMLGANQYDPENPRQRPFEFDVLEFDPRWGVGRKYGHSSAASPAGPVNAQLTWHQLRGDFGMLAPSIWAVAPNETLKELNVMGSFGADPGSSDRKVTIDDGSGPVALTVIAWSADLITVDLRTSGPGSWGNVIVEVRGHRSNPRQLLAWQGTMTYNLRDVGSLTQRFELDLLLRTDAQEVRNLPGQTPIPNPTAAFEITHDMKARFEAGGSWSAPVGECTATTDWAGSGTIDATPVPSSSGTSYVYGGKVDPRRALVEMHIAAGHPNGLKATGTIKCPNGTQSNTSDLSIAVDNRIYGSGSASNFLQLPLDASTFTVQGKTIQIPFTSHLDPAAQTQITLTWPTMVPKPAFDPTLPR